MLKKKGVKKKFVRRGIGQAAFFKSLNDAGVRYALLRWWKDFPNLAEGEDFDVLIHREDYPLIEAMLCAEAGGLRCDVYFHDAPGGNSPKKLPYFPLALAKDILEHRVLWKDQVYVPAPKTYFASLAFHGLYHKGYEGGVIAPAGGYESKVEHDYVAELTVAASDAGIAPISITGGGLHAWLTEHGYAPPLDMLGKLADKHPELTPYAGLPSFEEIRLTGELVLFVVRHAGGEDKAFLNEFTAYLQESRIEVLETYPLSPEEVARVSTLRGGNWGKGPYWKSAGKPVSFIVCYDWYPKPADGNHSLLLNGNITKLKEKGRKLYNKRRVFWNRCNPVHSPDNEFEACEFLGSANGDLLQRCKRLSQERKGRLRSPHEVLQVLSEGRRSRTDLVSFGGVKAVQKTFRFGSEKLCHNEVRAREVLAGEVAMPALIDHSSVRIVMEFLADSQPLPAESLSTVEKHRIAEELTRIVHAFWKRGFFHADFAPGNIFLGKDGRLHIIDFEFLQPYEGDKPPFNRAFEFEGIPARDAHYDRPWTDRVRCIHHHRKWNAFPFDVYFKPVIERFQNEASS